MEDKVLGTVSGHIELLRSLGIIEKNPRGPVEVSTPEDVKNYRAAERLSYACNEIIDGFTRQPVLAWARKTL